MNMETELEHFVDAQKNVYFKALSEIASGKKVGHWMWFIFPQFIGLGKSDFSYKYAISSIEQAEKYLKHPVLGARLRELSEILLLLSCSDPIEIFGTVDSQKLKSSLTLFLHVDDNEQSVFLKVLDKYFDGREDQRTLDLMSK